jgi:starch-binding outer membrane protein, SusD/RagB family
MKRKINIILVLAGFAMLISSCIKDLDTIPLDKDEITSATVYDNPAAYKDVLAKLYAGLAVSGQDGPAGLPDIQGIDEGFGQYLRALWYHQELPTDEAVIGWNDQTIKDFHWQKWGASDVFISAMYYRIYYQISLCNEYIRETTDSKLDERNQSDSLKKEVRYFRAEARFLRALSYWHAMDLFGNVPFVTEADGVGQFFPPQISRADLFDYIVNELIAIEPYMVHARQNEYGRADQGAAWMLLAKLYLNAEVYTGTAMWNECLTYTNKVITEGGYSLVNNYRNLFLADNENLSEVIFAVRFNGVNTQTWGGTTFIICAAVGGDMTPADFGIAGGWGGTRTTSAFVTKFADITGTTDKRAMFFTDGQNLEINDISLFTDGYAIAKWKNVTSGGSAGSNLTHADTDFPMFRLADAYLMYAEAVLRGGSGGDAGTALTYVNRLRGRAYANNPNSTEGNITAGDLTTDFILDERSRELYWEAQRRTDLVRFGKFTGGSYLWPWKGNVEDGTATEEYRNLFPLPSADVNANPNLVQNTGY